MTRRALLTAVVVVAALAAPVNASSQEADLRVGAAAWYLVGDDGTLLAQESSRRSRAIASITKLMTTIVALEHARPSDVVRVPAEAAAVGGSTIFLRGGEELTVAELVRGTLIPSANDAATALALHAGGGSSTRFVSLMNEKASELGLTDTSFTNPHGWTSRVTSPARATPRFSSAMRSASRCCGTRSGAPRSHSPGARSYPRRTT